MQHQFEHPSLERELQRLQECLDSLPVTVQATRARMLQNRLRERYGARQYLHGADGLQALLAVYEEGAAPHKLLAGDVDYSWTRDRWQCLQKLLPLCEESAPTLVEDSQVGEDVGPCATDFTSMQY